MKKEKDGTHCLWEHAPSFLGLFKIFADIGTVIVLFSDANNYRPVRLFGFLGNLVPSSRSIKSRFIFYYIFVIVLRLKFFAESAILFLRKNQRLKYARRFDTLHVIHLLWFLPGQDKPLYQEVISETSSFIKPKLPLNFTG